MFHFSVGDFIDPEIVQKLGDLEHEDHLIAVRLRALADPYTPADTLTMASTATVKKNELVYATRYAYGIYDGKRGGKPIRIKTGVHPQAQPFWTWAAKKDHMNELRAYATELLQKKLGVK